VLAIKGLTEDRFKEIIKENLTPAKAISSPQHLKGRAAALLQIDRAFNSPGKHIFIYGDRGVGKTSLAQTAAIIRQSSDADPILVSCGSDTFLTTIRDAVSQAMSSNPAIQKSVSHKVKAGVAGFGYEWSSSLSRGVVPTVTSVNEAVDLLKFLGECHSREPVIILDEFDQVADDKQRKMCADLLKLVSERAKVRFIICGIGTSIEQLIGAHLSAGRLLSPVEVGRLTHDARWEIVQRAAEALKVVVAQNFITRIGQISDGFPYYVHLTAEQMFWSMFDDPIVCGHCFHGHFAEGVNRAISEAETALKFIYDKATQKYRDDYQEVLWALADQHLLCRQTTDIYEKSYLPIMAERSGRTTISKKTFSGRLNKLKTDRHGEVIIGRGAGWYEFRDNVVRGYVRLRAEREGVKIGAEGFA